MHDLKTVSEEGKHKGCAKSNICGKKQGEAITYGSQPSNKEAYIKDSEESYIH